MSITIHVEPNELHLNMGDVVEILDEALSRGDIGEAEAIAEGLFQSAPSNAQCLLSNLMSSYASYVQSLDTTLRERSQMIERRHETLQIREQEADLKL